MSTTITTAPAVTVAGSPAIVEASQVQAAQPEKPVEVPAPQPPVDAADAQQEVPAKEPLPPEILQREMEQARKDAANYRTQLREAQEALKNAKSPEDIEAVVKASNEKIANLEREILTRDLASEASLPVGLAKYVHGSTAEEIKASIEQVKADFGITAPVVVDVAGGLTPNTGTGAPEKTPAQLAEDMRKRAMYR